MWFYNALLYLYPASFRREYGRELRGLFAHRMRQASGPFAKFALWLEATRDVVANAAAAHGDLLQQDLKFTARTLKHSPGFAITAILVTALGIGANTAAFSVADFVLIRPLPYADPERLVKLWQRPATGGRLELAPPNYRDYKSTSTSFSGMGAYHSTTLNMVGQGEPERLAGAALTSEVLPLLGVRPALGRLFTESEERGASNNTVVISYGLWQRAFGGDSGVLGKRVLLDGNPRVVVGVLPAEFHFPNREVSLWTQMPNEELANDERGNNWFHAIGKLKPGVTLEQARAELAVIAGRLESRFPVENRKMGAIVYFLSDEISSQAKMLLLALCGAALCVLLIACANLANLLIARSLARRSELALRSALGAGRERLVRQLITESLVLAALGGALGVAIAVAAVPLLSRLVPSSLPIAQSPEVDIRILLFAGVLTCITGIAFGVLPAIRASSKRDLSALREGMRSGGGRRTLLRSTLVIAEITASVVLLVSSGLLMRALNRLQNVDPGFRTEGVLTLRTQLPVPKYDSVGLRIQFYTQVLEKVRALPGVKSAAYISFLPMAMGGGVWPVEVPGEIPIMDQAHVASLRFATPDIFQTLSIPVKQGRELAESDVATSTFSAVVSESFVKRYWPGENPLGKHFKFAMSERTVVGVVADIRVRGLEQTSEPQVYVPYKQVLNGEMQFYVPKDLVIKTSGQPMSLVGAVRRIIAESDPQQPVSNVRTLAEIVDDQTASRSVQVRVLGAFAAVAFLLAAIGIHGLLAFTVAQRKHEFGVRMALGARQGNIVAMVTRQGIALALGGVIPGIALAYAAGRGMQSLLVGITPADALTFGAVAVLCIVMTLAGTVLPALRAVRVSPATVFRS